MTKIDRNVKALLGCVALVGAMLGLSFASVPLYRMFCQLTGFDGTPLRAEVAPGARSGRMITVRFDANIAPDLDWDFRPLQKDIRVETGAQGLVHYRAKSKAETPTVGIASFNVTPEKAAPFFNKIACFCFNNQPLKPGQMTDMGVSFFIDPAINDDPTLADVETITLSYTFFRAKDDPSRVADVQKPLTSRN